MHNGQKFTIIPPAWSKKNESLI